jgi:hypothetical protein
MVTYLFCPLEGDLSQHYQGDFESSLGSCDVDPFGDAKLFHEKFHPPSSSILDEHQDVSILERSKAHSTNKIIFILGIFTRIRR